MKNQSPIISVKAPYSAGLLGESERFDDSQHHATGQGREVAKRPFHRGTMQSKSFRALLNLQDVESRRDRFFSHTTPEPMSGCLLWFGSHVTAGYGQFRLSEVAVVAHRVAWVLAHGAIPERLEVDHLCRNRACVNAHHLRLVAHVENIETRHHNTAPARAALALKRAAA